MSRWGHDELLPGEVRLTAKSMHPGHPPRGKSLESRTFRPTHMRHIRVDRDPAPDLPARNPVSIGREPSRLAAFLYAPFTDSDTEIKLYRTRWVIGAILLLTTLYLVSRLACLLSLPIFEDEAIYLRWAQLAKSDASWRFVSLSDGKQPLFVWIVAASLNVVHDPLLAGRLVSTLAGFATVAGLFLLGRELFRNVWIGVLSAVFYVIFPMALVYDRLALYEGLVTTTLVWSLYLQVLFARKVQLDRAFLLGFMMGSAVLTKTLGFAALYLLPISFPLASDEPGRDVRSFVKWLLLAAVAVIVAMTVYAVLQLSPLFPNIASKNSLFAYSFSDWAQLPLATKLSVFWGNMWGHYYNGYYYGDPFPVSVGLVNWVVTYVTWPVLLLVVLSFMVTRDHLRERLLLASWFVLPFLALALTGIRIYPRYVFFMTVPLLVLAAYGFCVLASRIRSVMAFILLICVVVSLQLRSDFWILEDLKSAPIPHVEISQYASGWPSGGGVQETVAFLSNQAKRQKVFVGTEGSFGLLPSALDLYLTQNPNIVVRGYWPLGNDLPAEALYYAKSMPSYFVYYLPDHVQLSPSLPLRLVLSHREGTSPYRFRLYQIVP